MLTFRSKYDARYVGLAIGVMVLALSGSVQVWRSSESEWWRVSSAGLALLLLGTGIWTLAVMRYLVSASALDIHSGPLRWSVPLASIRSVEPSNDGQSAPAWSFDRLRVTTADRTWLSSPRDKEGFLAVLVAQDAGLRREGDRLIRVAVKP